MHTTTRALTHRRRAIAMAAFGVVGALLGRRAAAAGSKVPDQGHGDGGASGRSGIRVEVLEWQEASKDAAPSGPRERKDRRPETKVPPR